MITGCDPHISCSGGNCSSSHSPPSPTFLSGGEAHQMPGVVILQMYILGRGSSGGIDCEGPGDVTCRLSPRKGMLSGFRELISGELPAISHFRGQLTQGRFLPKGVPFND